MIQVIKIEPFRNLAAVAAIVSIYQQSFGNEPWNEGYQCPICAHDIPLGNGPSAICDVCSTQGNLIPMLPYWPTERVLRDFYREMSKRDAVCFVAKDEEEIVGFAWSYKIEINESIDAYLDAPGLHTIQKGVLHYLDEVAVDLPYRQRGIGEQLVRAIKYSDDKHPLLLRTKSGSPMSRLVEKMHGTILLSISQERIIAEIP